jgi:hypothetical protein
MIYKTNVRHDAFSFSLAGMSVVAAAIAPQIVASDRISKAWDAKLGGPKSDRPAPARGAGKPRPSWIRRIGTRLAWGTASQ